jgi:hypothetical protein
MQGSLCPNKLHNYQPNFTIISFDVLFCNESGTLAKNMQNIAPSGATCADGQGPTKNPTLEVF